MKQFGTFDMAAMEGEEKNKESSGPKGCLACCACCGVCAICCVVVVVVIAALGLGIAKIVMGAVYIDDCPLQYLIPIWLIVSGVAPILMSPVTSRRPGQDGEEAPKQHPVLTVIGVIGALFNLAWLICGTVWIYPNYGKRFADDFVACTDSVTTACTKDCNEHLMKFAVAMVSLDWIFTIIYMIYGFCMLCQHLKRKKEEGSNSA